MASDGAAAVAASINAAIVDARKISLETIICPRLGILLVTRSVRASALPNRRKRALKARA
jgi:hypothetical protein